MASEAGLVETSIELTTMAGGPDDGMGKAESEAVVSGELSEKVIDVINGC